LDGTAPEGAPGDNPVCKSNQREKDMIRNLRVLGLALVAVCAFAAVSASSASAITHKLTCAEATCIITGEQVGNVHAFGTKSSSLEVSCTGAKFGPTTISSGATSITIGPLTYSGCTALGFAATVDTTGCNYVLKGETDSFTNTAGASEGEKATVAVDCTGTNVIKITAVLGCTISIGNTNNQNLLGVKYDNESAVGQPNEVKVTVTVDKITYDSEKCPGIPAHGTDGFLTQTVTAKAFKDEGGTKEGPQIGLTQS
jgi:hypothetical protein